MGNAWSVPSREQSPVCPKGHHSGDADYCSECGARIVATPVDSMVDLVSAQAPACSDCGTPRDHAQLAYCEVCGFNFETGAHGEIPVPVAEEAPQVQGGAAAEQELFPAPADVQAEAPVWVIRVNATPTPAGGAEASAEGQGASQDYALVPGGNLVGRRDAARGIEPAIDLARDEAVSRRHAILLVTEDHRLLLRDIESANGTRLNGRTLEPMRDEELQTGDEIALGHGTRLLVGRHG